MSSVRTVRRVVALLLVAVLVASCSSGDDSTATGDGGAEATTGTTAPSGPVPSSGCEDGAPVEAGTTDRTMTSGGEERRFQAIVPEAHDGTTPLPLVLGLHALTVPNTVVAGGAGFADAAEDHDFVAVMPSGLVDGGAPYWLAAGVEPNHDLTFIGDLLDRLEADLCIDTAKVFSTGQSNGGQMSSLLACRMGERITAIAPVAGVEFPGDCDGGPVPVMAFHGDADPIVTYEGGGLNAATIADQQFWKGDVPDGVPAHGGVDEAMVGWADHNGCDPEPVEERVSPEVVRRAWDGCEAETVLYVVEGGGHTWPGRPFPSMEATFGPTTTDIDATQLMFELFLGPPS